MVEKILTKLYIKMSSYLEGFINRLLFIINRFLFLFFFFFSRVKRGAMLWKNFDKII